MTELLWIYAWAMWIIIAFIPWGIIGVYLHAVVNEDSEISRAKYKLMAACIVAFLLTGLFFYTVERHSAARIAGIIEETRR